MVQLVKIFNILLSNTIWPCGYGNANDIVYNIRNAQPVGLVCDYHPLAKLECQPHPFGW